MPARNEFERTIEKEVGETVDEIRAMPIDERRRKNEQKFGMPVRIVSLWNLIGWGSIFPEKTISHEEVEKELGKALRK